MRASVLRGDIFAFEIVADFIFGLGLHAGRLRNEVIITRAPSPRSYGELGRNFPARVSRKSDKPSTILVTITPRRRAASPAIMHNCARAHRPRLLGRGAGADERSESKPGVVARGEGYKINSDLDF